MQLDVDVYRSKPQTVGSESSSGWVRGLIAANDSQLTVARTPPYSFLADCECPDDCLRDHENE